jgi:cell division protein FtsQ
MRGQAVPASVRRFNQRARERRLRTARPFLVAAAIVALLGVVAWVVWRSPVLGVRSLRVEGNTLVTAEEVRAAAKVASGTPLAGIDLREVGSRVVAALPPVGRAEVKRDWPGTLVVTVTERTPAATVQLADKSWVVLDASGVVFEHVGAAAAVPVLVVSDPGPKDAATVAALTVLAALPPALLELLVRVEAPAPTRIKLMISGDRAIIWGDATQNEAKVATATALLSRSDDVIDVSAPGVVTVN